MAEFDSVARFVDTLRDLQAAVAERSHDATEEMAKRAERVLLTQARRDLGGDTTFSGWRGRDLADLRIRSARSRDGHWIFPTRKSGGPWKVAEQGRNQGNATGRGGSEVFFGPGVNRLTGETSRTKTGGVRRPRRFAAKRWSGYTAGKGTASRAVSEFEQDATEIAERMMRTAITDHLDAS